LAYSGYY